MRAERFRCSDLSTVPASCETGRRSPPVVTTFLTEADSDENCGPEVVPVDTDDELDSVVDALHHDLLVFLGFCIISLYFIVFPLVFLRFYCFWFFDVFSRFLLTFGMLRPSVDHTADFVLIAPRLPANLSLVRRPLTSPSLCSDRNTSWCLVCTAFS